MSCLIAQRGELIEGRWNLLFKSYPHQTNQNRQSVFTICSSPLETPIAGIFESRTPSTLVFCWSGSHVIGASCHPVLFQHKSPSLPYPLVTQRLLCTVHPAIHRDTRAWERNVGCNDSISIDVAEGLWLDPSQIVRSQWRLEAST